MSTHGTDGADGVENLSLEKSEQLDQLQADETLDDRGVDDILDEGLVPNQKWSPGQGYGNTAEEQRQGETLDQRLAQEEPDVGVADDWDEEDLSDDQVGDQRAGRLVAPDEGAHEDQEGTEVASDVGIDAGAATAEEAAVHVIPDEDDF